MLSLMRRSGESGREERSGSGGSSSGDESESGSSEDDEEDENDDEVKQEDDHEDEDVRIADGGLDGQDEVDIKPPPPTNKASNTAPTHPLKPSPPLSRIKPTSHNPTSQSTPTTPLKLTFPSLGLSPALISTLRTISILKPTEIQSACIEPILKGRDCVGGAKTGSGKTMAFALPILQRIMRDPYGIWAVVLTPTR